MKPIFQTVIDKGEGDCFRACLASLLELEIVSVPNFRAGLTHEDATPYHIVHVWLAERNLRILRMPLTEEVQGYLCESADAGPLLIIGSVPSQRFEGGSHSIIARVNGFNKKPWIEIIHDPNSDNVSYPPELIPTWFSILLPLKLV